MALVRSLHIAHCGTRHLSGGWAAKSCQVSNQFHSGSRFFPSVKLKFSEKGLSLLHKTTADGTHIFKTTGPGRINVSRKIWFFSNTTTLSPAPSNYLDVGILVQNRDISILRRRSLTASASAVQTDVQHEINEEQPVRLPRKVDTSAAEWGLPVEQLRQIDVFVDLLLDWNQRMNLTAVTERAAVMDRHIGDSLALLPVIEHALADTAELRGSQTKSETVLTDLGTDVTKKQVSPESSVTESAEQAKSSFDVRKKRLRKKSKQGAAALQTDESEPETVSDATGGVKRLRVVDVGTGAGLPGLVFAIARPEWDLILVESLRKRCTFLEQVILEAGLTNVTVVWGRAEDTVRLPNMRGTADVAVARAVADLRILSELCIPYVRKGGLFVAPKGPSPEGEVEAAARAIEVLGARVLGLEKVASSGPGGQRTAVVCVKETATPAKYPRRAGMPNKSPL